MYSNGLDDFRWKFKRSESAEFIDRSLIDKSLIFLEEWIRFFPKESTWVAANHHVPSIVIRLDCTIRDKTIFIYEIEERPAGIGISYCINPQFRLMIEGLRRRWPVIRSLISSNRKESDDRLWLPTIGFEEALQDDCLLLVRTEPSEEDFHIFQDRSVSTLRNKGDKVYGEHMGLWKNVSYRDYELFPWSEGFCLKPKQGSKCKGVHVWKAELNNKGVGISTKTQIRRVIDDFGEMYLQEYLAPMSLEIDGKKLYMNYRIYFGYDLEINSYSCLGGIWVARPNIRIHGASDATIGPLQIKED
ncbi:MAG: hypothetical protein PHW52_03910 [Candidatus Pacebacteria bacterium]|nr:hypothetical protein [Candidatus Paceibacterota bacterium]